MSNCNCSMAISVTGDGCRYCQPQEYIDKLAAWLEESRTDYGALEAECERLRAESENIRARWTEYGRELEAERDAAMAECERLRELLTEAYTAGRSRRLTNGELFRIDALKNAKPTEE